MTFVPSFEDKKCFVPCEQEKIDIGLCSCINRMRNPEINKNMFMIENDDEINILTAVVKKVVVECWKAILPDGTDFIIKDENAISKNLKDGDNIKGYVLSQEKQGQFEDGTYTRDLYIDEWFEVQEKENGDNNDCLENQKFVDIVLSNGYKKDNFGYIKITENNTHWITLFEGNSLQLYSYCSNDTEMNDVYNTQVLENVSEEELKTLIKILVNNNI